MNVPFFNYKHLFSHQREEILSTMIDVMEKGAFILQDELREFEEKAADYVGAPFAVGVANGTESMFIALKAAGVQNGDEVIIASHTYIATAAAIHFNGANPILVECGPDHMIDPESIRKAITPKTKFIMPTQLNGRVCDMDEILKIAKEHQLIVIEDAAQALGAKFKGKCAGTFGFAGSISLYPAKLLGCFGDGGLLFTNEEDTYRKLRLLRDHGRNDEGHVVAWGVNSRLDNLHAAVLLTKLKIYDKEIDRRREIAARYQERLGHIEDLTLPPAPDSCPDRFDVYQNYEIESGQREALRTFLDENGVKTIIQWAGTPIHRFEKLDLPKFDLPRTDNLFKRCFLLPMNTSLTDEEVDYVSDNIIKYYNQ